MGILRVMSRRGDHRFSWDSHSTFSSDPEARAAVREAERIFAQERQKGATAFRVETGTSIERIDYFDATASQIILIPRVIGGCR
jgi:hypothetical protein